MMDFNFYKKAVMKGTTYLFKIKKLMIALIGVAIVATGCSDASLENTGREVQDNKDNSVEYIKAQHPADIPQITYGQALDKVCGNQNWCRLTSEASDSGRAIVQMEADCNYGGEVRRITIQFNYGVRDFGEIDADTPFQITFVGFGDSEETPISVMQDLIYEMFAHYAADNDIKLAASVKDTILYSVGWNADEMTSNKTETITGMGPQGNEIQDDEEYNPLFEQFSELMYRYVDFSGMNDEEIQSYLEEAYEQWIMCEAYDEIVFDENGELTIQDVDDVFPTVTAPSYGETVALEYYLDLDLSAEAMGEQLQALGLDFVMDESGDYRSSDESVWLYNTDMGGSQIVISSSENNLYSIFGVSCGMSVEDAWNILEEYGADEVSSLSFSMNNGADIYMLYDSYMMTISYDEDWSKVENIVFDCYLW